MDCRKTGEAIRRIRIEKGLTQKELAEMLCVSDKTVSKWERALGCPDVSMYGALSKTLGVDINALLSDAPDPDGSTHGNMKNTKFFVCPVCGSITACTGGSSVCCCGRTLSALTPEKAVPEKKLKAERCEDDWYITSDYPSTKTDYISFIAFLTGDAVSVYRQYPEWDVSLRIPARSHGTLIWYSEKTGLLTQYI